MQEEIKPGYDRVSSVLRPFSGLSGIDKDILANAASRGTVVHKMIDLLIAGVDIFSEEKDELFSYCRNDEHRFEEEKKVDKMLESYCKWSIDKVFMYKPDRFYCDTLKITGEIDQFYVEDGKTVLVDFKTPANESKTWALQANAYDILGKENGYLFDRLEFVKLSKTGGKPKVFIYEKNHALFHSVLATYRYFYKEKEENFENLDYL